MFFPISKLCTGAYAANEAKVRVKNYPFDWIGNPYKQTAYAIDKGFDNLFENYEEIHNKVSDDKVYRIIWDIDYKIFFMHEGEDDISNIKKKYIKRYNNMITDLKNSDQVILIQSCGEEETLHGHYSRQQNAFKCELPVDEDLDNGSLECIKESILKINPNIIIKSTKYHEHWHEITEELNQIKENLDT